MLSEPGVSCANISADRVYLVLFRKDQFTRDHVSSFKKKVQAVLAPRFLKC